MLLPAQCFELHSRCSGGWCYVRFILSQSSLFVYQTLLEVLQSDTTFMLLHSSAVQCACCAVTWGTTHALEHSKHYIVFCVSLLSLMFFHEEKHKWLHIVWLPIWYIELHVAYRIVQPNKRRFKYKLLLNILLSRIRYHFLCRLERTLVSHFLWLFLSY